MALLLVVADFVISEFNFDLDSFELNSLESIGGSFIFDSFGITKLIGMDNLKTIGDDLVTCTSLFGFDDTAIQSMIGVFILNTMRFLRDVDELESLQSMVVI